MKLTLKSARQELAELGFTITKTNGEYRVNIENGFEATAYYTSDLGDAVETGRTMSTMNVGAAVTGNDLTAESVAKLQTEQRIRDAAPALLAALQAISALTVPCMSKEAEKEFEWHSAANAHRVEVARLILDIKDGARAAIAKATK